MAAAIIKACRIEFPLRDIPLLLDLAEKVPKKKRFFVGTELSLNGLFSEQQFRNQIL